MNVITIRKTCKEQCGYDREATWRLAPKQQDMTDEQIDEFIENQKRTFTEHDHECKWHTRLLDEPGVA
jgi:hypothetical protein